MKQARPGDSAIVAHARRELEMAKAFEKTKDYDGFLGPAILSLVKTFDHWTAGSGPKMKIVHQVFNSLIAGEILEPPTTDPEEWQRINREDGKDVLRNLRSPFYVSTDGGVSWTNTATGQRGMSRNHITGEDPEEPKEDGQTTTTSKEGDDTSTSEPESDDGNQPRKEGDSHAVENPSTSNGEDDKDAGKSAGDEGSSETPTDGEGRSLNPTVAEQGSEDSQEPKKAKAKPQGGEK